ncbi:hypothetical protein DV736_g5073, partial [Chaetothyriales sp. CBS 134916]
MSYADAAAKGPKQSPEEAKAAPVPSIAPSESTESASLIDVDSHIQSVKADADAVVDKAAKEAGKLGHDAKSAIHDAEDKVSKEAHAAKDALSKEAKKVKATLKADGKKLSDNRDNPVVVGNAVIWTIAAVAIGVGAYQKHSEGKLDWKLAGTVAGGVAAFSVADYFASSWLLENKFPPK